MKNIINTIALLSILFASCEDSAFKDTERLAEQLSGEWNIVRMTFPGTDSIAEVSGQAMFGSCINNCTGFFAIDSEIVNFDYNVTHFPDISSQISMGPNEGGENNILQLQPGTYDILLIDDHNLTIDLGYCEFTDNVCTTIHRHIVMTR